MKTSILLIAGSTALALSIQAATAKDKTSESKQSNSENSALSGAPAGVRLSKLMDAEIKSKSGEDLGKMEDVLINPTTGKIDFAVLGRGGFLGIGEKLVPIPWKALTVQSEKQFTINVDKQQLKSAPTTDKTYSTIQDPGYTVTIYRFFSLPVETETGAAESPSGSAQGQGTAPSGSTSGSSSSSTHHQPSQK